MNDTADWYWFWAIVIGLPFALAYLWAWVTRDRDVIPYRRVNDCKPGAFTVGRDLR